MNAPLSISGSRLNLLRLSTARLRQSAVWISLALTIVGMLVVQPALIAPEQWPILLRQAAPLGMLAIGQTVLLIGRGFDLSVGGVVGVVSVLAAGPFAQSHGAGAVIVLVFAFGLAVGLVNGVIVSYGKVSPLVVTLGTGFILTGAMLIYTGGAPSGHIPEGIRLLSRQKFLGIPFAVHIWLVLAVGIGLLLRKAWAGRYVYAIGASPKAALYAGVPVATVQLACYVLSSVCALVGGLLLAGFVGIGTLGAGQDLTLELHRRSRDRGNIALGWYRRNGRHRRRRRSADDAVGAADWGGCRGCGQQPGSRTRSSRRIPPVSGDPIWVGLTHRNLAGRAPWATRSSLWWAAPRASARRPPPP